MEHVNKVYVCQVYNTTDGYFALCEDCEGLIGEGYTALDAVNTLQQNVELRIKELQNPDGDWGWDIPKYYNLKTAFPSNTCTKYTFSQFHNNFIEDKSFIDFFTLEFTVFPTLST
jgi:hypothetical protein